MEWVGLAAIIVLAYPVNLIEMQVKFPASKVFDYG
jgi:hypothetical protein